MLLQGCATPYNLVLKNDAEGLRRYLAQGGNPDKKTRGWTGLHAAALHGRVEMARNLLLEGASVDAPENSIDATPLYVAAQGAQPEVVRLLLDAGASPHSTSRGGSSLLQRAAQSKCPGCVKHLLAAGSDPNAGVGRSALFHAAFNGDVESLKMLLAARADINATDKGMSPLYAAAQEGHVEVVRRLIAAGAALDLHTDDAHSTALYAAADAGHLDIVKMLINAGANVNLRTSQGSTTLMRAVEKQHHAIVDELLKAGADVNARGGNGGDWTPLLIASWTGDLPMMHRLYQAGADANARRNDGRTVEHMFNRRQLDQQQAEHQSQQRQQGGFQWGKFVALTAGAAAGGLDRMDDRTRFEVMTGIIKDSAAGSTGLTHSQTVANNLSAGTGMSGGTGIGTGGGAAGGSYAPRPNILDGHPACAGYTVDNYKSRFEAARGGPDVQLHTHCAGAYNYYWMYLNAIRQGYSQADSDRTYNAFHAAATTTIHFYQNTR